MFERCPVCGLYYEVEVGLFWEGYVHQLRGMVLAVGVLLYYLANDPPMWVYLTTVTTIIILSTTLLFWYARIVMLYYFSGIRYNPSYSKR